MVEHEENIFATGVIIGQDCAAVAVEEIAVQFAGAAAC
jgi:hypothetical protein